MFSSNINKNVLNADVLAGITKPAGASASIRVSIPTNVEAMSGFVPKDPQGLLDAYSRYSAAEKVAWVGNGHTWEATHSCDESAGWSNG